MDGLDIATALGDEAGEKAVEAAAAKGVPWAIVVVIIKKVIVTIAGVAGGQRVQCLAGKLIKPVTATKIQLAVVADLQRMLTGWGAPPGQSLWWGLRTPLMMCGFNNTERLVIQRDMYTLLANMSVSSAAQKKAHAKAYEIQKQLDAAAKKKLDEKLAIIQIQARIKAAKKKAKAKDAALYRATLNNPTGETGGGGGSSMLIFGAVAVVALALAASRR